ncbi:glycosyltransferase family 39 protein, partial [bacterium]|nr:glycosyltransferase family 39 protein [bacterium]
MSRWLAVVGVAVVATGLRFAGLGHWSVSGDELATTREARVLFDGLPADPASQTARLPRLIPAGYLVQYLGYRTFGTDEWGSRVPAAVAGSILPPLIAWLLWRPLGGYAATATGLFLAVSPEAVFQSQQNRFYMSAGLVAGGCVAAAAVAVRDRHAGTFCVAGATAAIAPLFHPVLAALAPGLAAATWLGMPAGPDHARRRFLVIAGVAVAVVVLVVAGYHLPLLRQWNAGAGWGYPTGLAVLAGVKRLGVPAALLAALGAVLMFRADRPAFGFWAVWAGGWAATLVVLPSALAYQPAYSFPFLLGPVVPAGYAVGEIARTLREQSGRAGAVVWVAAACLSGAPALVSHYADGSRYNHRAAAAVVADRRRPGEAVAAVSPGNLAHYRGELADAAGLDPAVLTRELSAVGRRGRP